MKPFTQTSASSQTLDLLWTHQVFLAKALETAGQIFVANITVPPGTGIPLHRHTYEDETFVVTSGSLRCAAEGMEERVLGPGDLFFGPRLKAHSFSCEGEAPVILLGVAVPGTGVAGMYDAIQKALDTGGVTPEKLGVICEAFGIHFL